MRIEERIGRWAMRMLMSPAGFAGYRARKLRRWRGEKNTGISRGIVGAAVKMATGGKLLRPVVVKAIEAEIVAMIRSRPKPKPLKARPRKTTSSRTEKKFSEGAEKKERAAPSFSEGEVKERAAPSISDMGHRA